MIILTKQDFRGRFEVTFPKINNRDDVVEATLASMELEELTKLFGMELATQFKSDPTNAIYDDLYTPLMETFGCGCDYRERYSEGLKEVLLSLIYLRYQRGNYSMSTENGRVLKDSSTSKVLQPYTQDIEMYNRAVNGWRAIQIYSRREFSDFKGVDKPIQMY